METSPKARRDSNGSSGRLKKASPKVVKKLSIPAFGSSSLASCSSSSRGTPKNKSPEVADRRSPKTPITEKHASKISELESQLSKLRGDLNEVKEKLIAYEMSKEEAMSNAEELKAQLESITLKLKESQNKLSRLLTSKEAHQLELHTSMEDQIQVRISQIETAREQQSANASALDSALDEINVLKDHLEAAMIDRAESKATQAIDSELEDMKNSLEETRHILETMKNEMRGSKESEARAHERAREAVSQLQAAKQTVSELQFHRIKALDAYNTRRSELEQSRAHVEYLEDVMRKLKANHNSNGKGEQNQPSNDDEQPLEEAELGHLRSEVGQLRYTLEAAEVRFRDEQEESCIQIKSAYELVDQMKSQSGERLSYLESQLREAVSEIEELRANLMDKETELQGIVDENQSLVSKVNDNNNNDEDDNNNNNNTDTDNNQQQQSSSRPQLNELRNELERLEEEVSNLKICLVERDCQMQKLSEENENLKAEMIDKNKNVAVEEVTEDKGSEELSREGEASRVGEEALEKLVVVMEEAEKNKKRADRAGEQLEAVQATMARMESELRRLKVQLDQWRKAAEAAAATMLSKGGGGGVGKRLNGAADSNGYSPVGPGTISSPYMDDYEVVEGGFGKKKNGNGNVLKKIGGIWKKPLK